MGKANLRKSFLILILLLLLSAGASSGQEKAALSGAPMKDDSAGAPSIKFRELRFEAGTVQEGTVVSRDFEFTNEGTGALKIGNVVPA